MALNEPSRWRQDHEDIPLGLQHKALDNGRRPYRDFEYQQLILQSHKSIQPPQTRSNNFFAPCSDVAVQVRSLTTPSTSHKSIFTSTFNLFKKPSSRNAKMAGDKGENVLNMSQAELKLIALGCRFSEGGKPDYEQIAKYGGYTKGSAQVMYRKALRKLIEAWPVDGDAAVAGSSSGLEIAGNNDPVTPSGKAKTPKTPRSRASTSGKKRKDAAGAATATGAVEDQDITPSAGAQTPFTSGAEGLHEAGAMVMETPTKKPKKAPAKQSISSFTSVNAPDDDDFLKDEPLFEPAIKTE